MKFRAKRIAIDFDGVVVEHLFPEIGQPVPGAIEGLIELQQEYKLFLWTVRSGEPLEAAVAYLEDNGIELMCEPNVVKGQHHWSESPKAHCEIYIDDAAIGCPLIWPADGSRPYADWSKIPQLIHLQFRQLENEVN